MFRDFDVFKLAAAQLLTGDYLIVDAKTTGPEKNDEIIELGIIDNKGKTLYKGTFRTEKQVNRDFFRDNGIPGRPQRFCPTFKNEFDKIMKLLDGHGVVVFNEAELDRAFCQTARKYELNLEGIARMFNNSADFQRVYNQYIGYENTDLDTAALTEGLKISGHSSIDNCLRLLGAIEKVADRDNVPDVRKYIESKAKIVRENVEEAQKRLKEDKVERRMFNPVYAELWSKGKSVAEIAEEKGVKVRTVEEGIVNAFVHGVNVNLDEFVQPEFVRRIVDIIKDPGWNGRLTPVKEALPDECTWVCIRAVVAMYGKGLIASEEGKHSLMEVINEARNHYGKDSATQDGRSELAAGVSR